jgi:hypothetical protein
VPYLTGQVKESPRESFFYVSDDGGVMALRHGDWKLTFQEQRCKGTLENWAEPFTKLRLPHMYSLRRDPFERADFNSSCYWEWIVDHAFLLYGAQAVVAAQIDNYVKYPPRQKPASFNLDSVMAQLGPAIQAYAAKEAASAKAAATQKSEPALTK